ncbi:MAG: hypothetical protein ACK4V6_11515 [Microthrixaceae bacterium]
MPDHHPSRPGTLVRRVLLLTGTAAVLAGCTGTSSSQVEVSAEPEPADTTTTTTPPDCAEQLPPAAQAGQLLMTMVTSPTLAADVVASGQVAGFGLKGRQSTDVGDEVRAGPDDAIVVETDPVTGEPAPRIHVRRDLWARIARPVFYELVELAEEVDGRLIVRSGGQTFSLGAVA